MNEKEEEKKTTTVKKVEEKKVPETEQIKEIPETQDEKDRRIHNEIEGMFRNFGI